jgi:hypothetical protein
MKHTTTSTSKVTKRGSDINDIIEQYKDKVIPLEDCETVDSMTVYEMARWCSLLEAVEVVDAKCKSLKLPVKDNSWIKPIAFQKFVDERTNSMMFEIINEIEEGKVPQY